MSTYDTIIIGAGMSGLAAGIRLAHYDQKVCILERHTTIGGLNSFYRLGGRNYDVGLHAVTNFVPKGTRRGPLPRLLRQLRFQWDDFDLSPQLGSSIAFPGVRLDFTNDPQHLCDEIAEKFPAEADNFRRLMAAVVDYDDIRPEHGAVSARQFVGEYVRDPLLVEMLFCPLMYYGSAREQDMDLAQFSIMFRSIFLEGLARPWAGVRLILKLLTRRYKSLGGELRLRAGVRQIAVEDGQVHKVVLDDGTELAARQVVSSAGWLETMRLCDPTGQQTPWPAGQLSFVEAMAVLDTQPRSLGCDRTIVFFNDSPKFHWQKSEGLVDTRSGVICSPNNFDYGQPLEEGMMRITAIANYDLWNQLPEDEYRQQKQLWFDRVMASAVRFVPDFRGHIIDTDMFTPTTIRRFTWHDNGAVYGSPRKQLDGRTHLPNLFICGTDQGFVGIIGAIVSGISIANQHCLNP